MCPTEKLRIRGCEVVGNTTKRKTRSDKKRDVKPFIPMHLKDNIYLLSYIYNVPVKDISESICRHGIHSKKVIDHLSQYFKRDVRLDNSFYYGCLGNPSTQRRTDKTYHERITIKFKPDNYEDICLLAYTLDATPSRATAVLIDASFRNPDFIYDLAREHGKPHPQKEEILEEVLAYIATDNPYDSNISFVGIVKMLAGEVLDFAVNGWR